MGQARFGFGLQFDDTYCRIKDLVLKYKSKTKAHQTRRCGGHCEELPRYSSFKQGSLVSDAERFVVTGLQLPASPVIVPVAECLTQGHILFWSGPHPVTDYLHLSGDILNEFQSCSLGSGDCLLSLYYRSAFSSVQPCFFFFSSASADPQSTL